MLIELRDENDEYLVTLYLDDSVWESICQAAEMGGVSADDKLMELLYQSISETSGGEIDQKRSG